MIRKINKRKMAQAISLCLVLTAALCWSCDKDDDGGASVLAGTWRSVTGTVNYTNSALTDIVNDKMATYDLAGMSVLAFEKDGKMGLSDEGLTSGIFTYTFDDNVLKCTPYQGGRTDYYKVTVNGDELTLTHEGSFVGEILKLIHTR